MHSDNTRNRMVIKRGDASVSRGDAPPSLYRASPRYIREFM
jgi:hypothetical protein